MRLAAVAVVGLATTALLTGCNGKDSEAYAPKKVSGQAAPALGDTSNGGSKKESDSPSSPSDSTGGSNGSPDSPTGPSEDRDEAGSSGGGTGGSEEGPSDSGGACRTSQLALSASDGGAGSVLVKMENTGSALCTLKGFPGADLYSDSGEASVNAGRTDLAASTVSIKPGEATHFNLSYTPNESGGSGVTFDSLVVTPPNETETKTLPINVNVAAADTDGRAITVDPIGQ